MKAYDPTGSILTSIGDTGTNYDFTGEQSDATGLTHLRARYLSTGQGRFLSRDTWGTDPRVPMSANLWLYALANPANLSDPSGWTPTPCREYPPASHYCRVTGGTFDGAIIDVTHFLDSRDNIARQIQNELQDAVGDDPGSFKITTPLLHGFKWTGSYMQHYRTWLPTGIPDGTVDRIALGVFMHFQWGYEFLQMQAFPLTLSGFANEDLPSDYLGFAARVIYPDSSLNDVMNWLTGAESLEEVEDLGPYQGNIVKALKCYKLGQCADTPFNCDFVFKLIDAETGSFRLLPWPGELGRWRPVLPGKYWEPETLISWSPPWQD